MEKDKILNENEIELEDPDVIHINENDDERVKEHDEDEENGGNFFERFFGKRPSEKALKKISIVSFILGVLSCSLLFGNLITSALGIILALKNEKHKYKSFFSTAGFILSAIGLILGAIITGIIILIPVVVILLAAIALVIAIVLMVVILLILLLLLMVLLAITTLLFFFVIVFFGI